MILLGFLWEFIRLTGLFGLLHSFHPRSPVHSSLITQPLPCLMTTCTCRVLVEQLWICQAPWHLLALTRLASLFPRTLRGFKCSGTLPSFRNFLEALEVIEPKLGGPVWEFGLQKTSPNAWQSLQKVLESKIMLKSSTLCVWNVLIISRWVSCTRLTLPAGWNTRPEQPRELNAWSNVKLTQLHAFQTAV